MMVNEKIIYKPASFSISKIPGHSFAQMRKTFLALMWKEGRSVAAQERVFLVRLLAWCQATGCGLIVMAAIFWV